MGDLFLESDAKTSRFETTMWAAKLVFLSAGIISTYMFFKVAIIPYIFNLVLSVISSVTGVWVFLRSWLSPPYIYLVLNVIIITIAASSTFRSQDRLQSLENRGKSTVIVTMKRKDSKPQKKKRNVNSSNNEDAQTEDFQLDEAENVGLEREDETNPSEEKNFKDSSTEDSVETPEKTDEPGSLEETWNLIAEKQGKDQNPQLKKINTFDTPLQTVAMVETGANNGDGEADPAAWAKGELSQDELNRRVEAFIRKFNNDIRSQRLESDPRYMVNGS